MGAQAITFLASKSLNRRLPTPRAPLQCFAPSASGARGALGKPHGVTFPPRADTQSSQRAGLGWAPHTEQVVYLYTPNRVSRAQLRKIYCRRAESCAFACVGHSTRAHCGARFELEGRGVCRQLAPTCRSGHASWAGPGRRSRTFIFMHFT